MRFSRRTNWNTEESALALAIRRRRQAGLPILDLTASNPTDCGFTYQAESLLAALARPQALHYEPNPRGMRIARDAVSRYCADHQAPTDPDQIVLTTSTSEAYSFVFRLLCDPGDEVLIAQPSYPLFDYLAELHDVRLVSYPLFYDHGWHLDLHGLREQIGERTRAILVVHPNNPTGHATSQDERRALEALAVEHGLALVVDEVFLDYPFAEGGAIPSFGHPPHAALTFVLSGLSKIAGLPQMKASWIACYGAESGEALNRLEIIADTFLSMNAPIQGALPDWLASRAFFQQQVHARVRANLAHLDAALATRNLILRLTAEAGWYAVLRIPALKPDEDLAVELVRQSGVLVHPGAFFGMPASGWLVLSLLIDPATFLRGVQLLLSHVEG